MWCIAPCRSMRGALRRSLRLGLLALLAPAVLHCAPATAQTRVALVVGNGAYRHVPVLPNPGNDASDVAASLERLDFTVRRVSDATFEDMRRALLEFGQRARRAEIAVMFFAGHGMEIGGENWLVPVDAELKADLDADHEAVALKSIMPMVAAASKLGLVVLDACRNNPFAAKMQRTVRTRALERGLTRIEPVGSVLVAYGARDGTTAGDGSGRNSPFTAALLRHIETPGLEINFLFRNVRDDVLRATQREQEPFVYGALSKEAIYLKDPAPVPVAAAPSADEVMWEFLKGTNDTGALKRFAEQFPGSARRPDAEQRMSALTAEAEQKLQHAAQADRRELARLLQLELRRVGCFDGAINGEFDEFHPHGAGSIRQSIRGPAAESGPIAGSGQGSARDRQADLPAGLPGRRARRGRALRPPPLSRGTSAQGRQLRGRARCHRIRGAQRSCSEGRRLRQMLHLPRPPILRMKYQEGQEGLSP